MNFKRVVWLLAAVALMLLPFFSTGCGTDDAEADQQTGIYTVGPGNLSEFPAGNIKGE
ncbi:MAG: hypothetical protein PWR01_3309 [Clostridiales bacterium]|jgi:4-hydroxybenzoate polyprenyltransferase|nr:hypothetical protein [Clostridiales bacterium]MDN5282236.1 hypothetical protein [Candidatus Ozemobacter sp.]